QPRTLIAQPRADSIDPFHFTRRETTPLTLAPSLTTGPEQPPRVIPRLTSVSAFSNFKSQLSNPLTATPTERILVPVSGLPDLAELVDLLNDLPAGVAFIAVEADPSIQTDLLRPLLLMSQVPMMLVRRFVASEDETLRTLASWSRDYNQTLAIATTPEDRTALAATLRSLGDD